MAITPHTHEYFYRHLSWDGLLATLQTMRLRWRSPIEFNDPLDTQYPLRLDRPLSESSPAMLHRLQSWIVSRRDPPQHADSTFRLWLALRREAYVAGAELGNDALDLGGLNAELYLADVNAAWLAYVRNLRVLCLSETHDCPLMWAHYCGQHTGAVIKLRCCKEHDSAWLAAQPVVYRDKIPPLMSIEQWIDRMDGSTSEQLPDVFEHLTLVKGIRWSYEREWRCVVPDQSKNPPLSEWRILPCELAAVYLGCRVSVPDRDSVRSLLRSNAPECELLCAEVDHDTFGLRFVQVPGAPAPSALGSTGRA